MKNIHVLPAENESRIRYNSFNKVYELCEFPKYHTDIKSTYNIYITSDEKLPYDSSIINNGAFYHRDVAGDVHIITKHTFKPNPNFCKKIILTTDQDLIKDGVQAIDDEFLEWFVKNPSYDSVLVEYNEYEIFGNKSKKWIDSHSCYKIIIPKEDWLLNNPHCKQIESCSKSLSKKCICQKEEPKQETLEEVAKDKYGSSYGSADSVNAFVEGAKWQQEKIGKSEFLQKLRATLSDAEARRLIFEQFKNK